MTDGFDWHVCRADALAEQFPTLAQVRDERPGCDMDRRRQAYWREATELKKARLAVVTRERMLAEALEEARRRQAEQTANYRAHQARKHNQAPATSGASSSLGGKAA